MASRSLKPSLAISCCEARTGLDLALLRVVVVVVEEEEEEEEEAVNDDDAARRERLSPRGMFAVLCCAVQYFAFRYLVLFDFWRLNSSLFAFAPAVCCVWDSNRLCFFTLGKGVGGEKGWKCWKCWAW